MVRVESPSIPCCFPLGTNSLPLSDGLAAVSFDQQTWSAQMKITRLVPLCAAVIAAFAGCLAQPAHADGVRPAIEAANAQFSAAAAKGDGAGLAALYAADGQVLPAGSDVIRGRDAIQKFWQGALDSGIAGVGLKTLEVFDH